ncbi:hsp70 family chaperone lhs1 [Grosmannia clavigera kw1407]|uniref:Hsp70 family chaperone lhs1 n=1 Tax=Grosmannia clavigera (strain kw1407 / UAMH 11150) TaxID=655863 RepID=F0X7D2_GROCL|nr:hsp70 family chaperone lhs1 [Grosmannia clavigera kw1407]EFX06216.1 hsp70 family chaperone lhs1 [Grosmannia clavigera kw1407]
MAGRKSSPLLLLLCSVVLFCGQAFSAAAVLGVDLGTEYIKAALVKPGIPLDIVLTKDSRRKETSAVTFKPPRGGPKEGSFPERLYGSDAMALAARFPGDVYPNLKTLLGLPVDGSPIVQEYAARHPALKLEAHEIRKTSAFKSSGAFTADQDAWLVEELLAMELQSVRRSAEAVAGPGSTVRSIVITVPPFYTVEEKRAVELAADLAGLRVLSLISDGLAVGLNYATSRQFPNINDGGKPEINMVFDMGAGSTKATILKFQSRKVKDVGKFNKTIQEVQVLGSGWDRTLGGDTLNALIIDHMVAQFIETSGAKAASVAAESIKSHGRAIAKLSKEAERIRHVLSANLNTAASFEGLFEDVDFRYKISRVDFEKMTESHAERVAAAVQQALDAANLKAADLDSIILHGGATRTPFVQKQLEQIFGSSDKLRNNVNSDEAAVFGAGFRAAEISPSFRVKEIRVADGAAYSSGMKWTNEKTQKVQHQQLWTPTSQLGTAPKEITFHNKDDFAVEFYQLVPDAAGQIVQAPTKVVTTKNLTETVALMGEKYSCEPSAVELKVGMRLSSENGEVEFTKFAVECETEEEKESIMDGVKNLFGFGKNKDQQPLKDAEGSDESASESASSESTTRKTTSSTASNGTKSSSASASTSATASSSTHTKKVTISVPVSYEVVKAGIPQLSRADNLKLKDRLAAFEASDRARQQREEALNHLEAFTYRVRSLLENEDFIEVSTEVERVLLEQSGLEASDWLYGEGADASHEELKAKHTALKELVDPVESRITEHEKRPALVTGLKEALEQIKFFGKSIRDRIEEYESYQASKTVSSSTTSSSSTEDAPTAAASVDDFAGLEDDEATTTAASNAGAKDGLVEDDGPVPPVYTLEDLAESEELYLSVSVWLAEKEEAQAKLGPKENPVLTIEELKAKRDRVDKVSMDLAMKAVRKMESTKKKAKSSTSKSKSKSSSKTKTSKSTKTKSATSETASSATSAEPIPTEASGKEQSDTVKHEEL